MIDSSSIGCVESKVVTKYEFASLLDELDSDDEGIFCESKNCWILKLNVTEFWY